MAGIDKTYVNKEQYLEARVWWANNYKLMIEKLGYAIFLYPFEMAKSKVTPLSRFFKNKEDLKYFDNISEGVLWNTSCEFDLFLCENCQLEFVIDRLLNVYDCKTQEQLKKELQEEINGNINHEFSDF